MKSNPVAGDNYYRLKEVGANGLYAYSEIIVLKIEEITGDVIYAYPNPIQNKTSLLIQNEGTKVDYTRLYLYNVSGKIVHQQPFDLVASENVVELDMTAFPKGYYYLSVKRAEFPINTLRLLKI